VNLRVRAHSFRGYISVHGVTLEAHAARDLHRPELDDVVVLHVVTSAAAGLALIRAASVRDGVDSADRDTIRVLDEPIWGNPAIFSRIGFCPEQDAFYDRMTGLEWVTALVRLNGYSDPEADAAAKRALERVELLDAGGKKIGAYSKGMRQRVKMAQALVHDPDLLILDEPLTGMDPLMRRKTIRLIKDWARAGKHIIVSSHILHEIESMTANILLINNGRILAEGDVHQIRDMIDEHPHTVFVRAADPRGLARAFLAQDDVRSLRFESNAVVVETGKPDVFYARLTEMAASEEFGPIDEVTSPDDNLQAVFQYLVK
jgi:ABC-2 type transport system ATP-binding protein